MGVIKTNSAGGGIIQELEQENSTLKSQITTLQTKLNNVDLAAIVPFSFTSGTTHLSSGRYHSYASEALTSAGVRGNVSDFVDISGIGGRYVNSDSDEATIQLLFRKPCYVEFLFPSLNYRTKSYGKGTLQLLIKNTVELSHTMRATISGYTDTSKSFLWNGAMDYGNSIKIKSFNLTTTSSSASYYAEPADESGYLLMSANDNVAKLASALQLTGATDYQNNLLNELSTIGY